MTAGTKATIEGWSAIADYLAARAPISLSTDSVMRWARRTVDPLPVHRWGRPRPRVYALVAELDAWLDRQHRGSDGGER